MGETTSCLRPVPTEQSADRRVKDSRRHPTFRSFGDSGLFHQKAFPWVMHATCMIGKSRESWARGQTTLDTEFHPHSIRAVSETRSQESTAIASMATRISAPNPLGGQLDALRGRYDSYWSKPCSFAILFNLLENVAR